MKISSASKKVLASALSAAMVVAFAPTVAFGAQEGQTLKVSYDLAGGTDANAGNQDAVKDGDLTVNSQNKVSLADGTALKLVSDDASTADVVEGYEFASWEVYADTDKDGAIDTSKDTPVTVTNGEGDVSKPAIDSSTKLFAKATYKTATIDTGETDVRFENGKATFKAQLASANVTEIKGAGKFVVTAPDGTTQVSKAANGATQVTLDKIAAQVGAYTVALVDGNGVTLSTQTVYVGSVKLTGGAFQVDGGDFQTEASFFYVADDNTTLSEVIGSSVEVYKVNADGTKGIKGSFYNAKGDKLDLNAKVAGGEKGAVETVYTANFGAALTTFAAKGRTLTATVAGVAPNCWATADQYKAPKNVVGENYYVTITDASGKVVASSADNQGDSKKIEYENATNGTYTATLYKVGGYKEATATTAAVDGTVEQVATLTATVDAVAASPSWSYAPAYKADGSVDYGMLALTNNAGDGFKVQYKIGGGSYTDYDATKGYLKLSASQLSSTITVKATNGKDDDALVESLEVVLVPSTTNARNFSDIVGSKTIGNKIAAYYKNDEGVKAAVAAAAKGFTDAGYKEQVLASSDNSTDVTWHADSVAAYKSVLDAVAAAAKAELAAQAAPVTHSDGSVSYVTAENLAAAEAAVDAAVAAYVANNDSDAANDVSLVNGVGVSGAVVATDGSIIRGGSYVDAINAPVAAVEKTDVTKAQADAAAAVTAQLKAAAESKDAAAAQAAIEAYAALPDVAKGLVSTDDLKAAHAVVDAQAAIDEQDKTAVKYCNSTKTKTIKLAKKAKKTKKKFSVKWNSKVSESGNAVTYAKVSGAKITVSANGKATLKKGVKKGTYKAKVKVSCGNATRTVTAKFIVK